MAVGETIRRLTSRLLIAPNRTKISGFLEPLQVGVGVPGGGEGLIHAVRQWIGRNRGIQGKVVVLMDLSNAFNCLDTSAFREITRLVVPDCGP